MGVRIALRRGVVVAVVVLGLIAGLTSAAQAASTPVTPGTPVHVKLAPNASQSFTVSVKKGQTLAAETTLSDILGYRLIYPSGGLNYESGVIGGNGLTGKEWNNLPGGTYTLEFTADSLTVQFDLTLKLLDVEVATAQPGVAGTQRFVTPWQNVILTVHAQAGQHVGLLISDSSLSRSRGTTELTPRVNVQIAPPATNAYDGVELGYFDRATAASGFFELPVVAPVTGDYAILLDPEYDTTGSIAFTPYVTSDVVRTASLGRTQTMNTTTPGQNQVIRFKGAVGYRPILRVTKVELTARTTTSGPEIDNPRYYLRAPNGIVIEKLHEEDQLRSTYLQFAKAGVWAVVIDPEDDYVGHIEYTLTLVKDAIYTPKANTNVTVSITAPGQNAALAMDLKKGQRLVIRSTAAHWKGGVPTIQLLAPDGSSTPFSPGFFETEPLTVTGRYYLSIDPFDVMTGSQIFRWSRAKT